MRRSVIMAGIITILAAGSHGTDRYVSLSGTNDDTGGYTNWAGAATQIHWAVDMGCYERIYNCVETNYPEKIMPQGFAEASAQASSLPA